MSTVSGNAGYKADASTHQSKSFQKVFDKYIIIKFLNQSIIIINLIGVYSVETLDSSSNGLHPSKYFRAFYFFRPGLM
jgi:hypothetical protein